MAAPTHLWAGGFMKLLGTIAAAAAILATTASATAQAQTGPQPGTPEYLARDTQNIADAYGRQTQQQLTPTYLAALALDSPEINIGQLAQQAAQPNRPSITPGNVFPGWNVGNPLRRGWSGRRGLSEKFEYTNRYGALIRGT